MANPTAAANHTRLQVFLAIISGLFPYFAGLLVLATRNIGWLTLWGALVCIASTSGRYFIGKHRDPVTAKQRLLIDPMLCGFEFALTAVLIRHVVIR